MSKCDWCRQEMSDGVGCTLATYDDFADNIERDRLPADHDCHDCKAPQGTLHHPGCDDEKCPKCKGQAIACECTEQSNQEGEQE